jgi:hypothetical protein
LFISYIGYCRIGFDSSTNSINHNQTNQEESSTPVSEVMAKKTLCEFSAPSTENIHTGPTLKTNNLEFELKPSLINMVQATQFSGKAHEDASAHLQNFLKISGTIVIKDVAQDIILLCLFPFSLVGRAK